MQAPKTRTGTTAAPGERRARLLLYGVAAAGFIGVAVAIALFAFARGGDAADDVQAALEDAGCTFRSVPATRSSLHLQDESPKELAKAKYNSVPATSGWHYLAAPWGEYDSPVDESRTVHNLEHGGVAIQYGPRVPREDVQKAGEFVREDPNAMLMAPMPKLGNKIALTAWTVPETQPGEREKRGQGRVARCTRFDEDAFAAFRDEFRGKGPERIPVDALTPGT